MKILAALALTAIPALALAEPPTPKPGQYTVTMTMEMNGRKMGPMTHTNCVDKVGDWKSFMQASQRDKTCQLDNFKFNGNKATFDMNCNKNGEASKGHADVTFGPSGIDTTMTFDTKNPKTGEPMHMSMTSHSERTGECN